MTKVLHFMSLIISSAERYTSNNPNFQINIRKIEIIEEKSKKFIRFWNILVILHAVMVCCVFATRILL